MSVNRTRPDMCPGVFRPWPADDGLLVRLRLIGGRVSALALRRLSDVAVTHGNGRVYVTSRANIQLRGFAGEETISPRALADLRRTGLVLEESHDLVRNIMVSPLTSIDGGHIDAMAVAKELDRQLIADSVLAGLPAKFLFVLDDGRGDMLDQRTDLGLVALDADTVQLRIADHCGPVVPLNEAVTGLVERARKFIELRGSGADAPWHIRELATAFEEPAATDTRMPAPAPALAFGPVSGGYHQLIPETGLDGNDIDKLTIHGDELVVTPWRGIWTPRSR